jgi:hypothetical protein
VLLVIGFLESVLTQFFAPAEQAAIPLLVPREGLMSANALFTTTMMGSLIVGFAIGDPVLSLAKSGGRFGQEILLGGLYILAAVSSTTCRFAKVVLILKLCRLTPGVTSKRGWLICEKIDW